MRTGKSTLILLLMLLFLVSCSKDAREWEKVKSTDNINEIEDFLSNFPESTYYDSAFIYLGELVWEEIKSSNNIDKIENYLARFPESAYYDSANNYLKRLVWENIKSTDNTEEIEIYLTRFPESNFFDSALIRLEKLTYLKSLNRNYRAEAFEEYEKYVRDYPRIKEFSKVKVGFIKRTHVYKLVMDNIRPAENGYVLVIMQIEGAALKDVNSTQKPYVEFNGEKHVATYTETSGKRIKYKDGKVVKVFEPFISFCFAVPETVLEVKLIIDNNLPVYINIPTEASEELSVVDL